MLLWVAWVYKYLLQTLLSMLLGIYPEMWLPDHMAILYVVSSIVATPFYILPSGAQNFQFRYILPKYVIWGVLDSSHSHRCEVVSYCSFNLCFPNKLTLSSFSCAYWPFVHLLWRYISSSPLPIKTPFLFWPHHMAYRILVPQPGIKPAPPWSRKQRVLATGSPGKILLAHFWNGLFDFVVAVEFGEFCIYIYIYTLFFLSIYSVY